MTRREAWYALGLVLSLAVGCSSERQSPQRKGEDEVREVFATLQGALKGKDAETLWTLLDADSQADADRAAQVIKAAYEKAGPDEKAQQEKALGLSSTE